MSAAAEFAWIPDSETELRSVFRRAPVGLAQCWPGGKMTVLNPALERMFGEGSKSGICPHFSDLVHSADRDRADQLLRELFEKKRGNFQLESKKPAGGNVIRWTGWRVPGNHRNSDYALMLAEELRGNPVAEQRQAQNLETVGRLAGGVAHDFNNLLTGVLLYCDLLIASLDQDHHARKYAEEIRNAGVQATGLVRQLLAVAKPGNSSPRLLSLNDVAESMRNLLLRLIGENVRLEFHLDPSLGLVKMDQTQAQQILLNLVLNARDAMPDGGEIRVETRNCRIQIQASPESVPGNPSSLPCALFAVEDNGNGMDEITRARVFEAFFTTKGGKGTGLGLATVHDIVTTNGGLIHVESSANRGTRVTVLLPVIPENTSGSQNANPAQLPPLLEKKEGAFPHVEKE
jgi:two-component system, cell cycle sensor histidine kinase and response regulator CckA